MCIACLEEQQVWDSNLFEHSMDWLGKSQRSGMPEPLATPLPSVLQTWRFVSGLTLKTPHCVQHNSTCHVLSGHRAQLQGELVLGCVSGDKDVALEAVVSVTIVFYLPQPFQALPWGLVEPSPVIPTVNGVI
jgi:hypothetical protein